MILHHYLIKGKSGKNKTISRKYNPWSMALGQRSTKRVRIVFLWWWFIGICHQMPQKGSRHWCDWCLQWSNQNLDSESKRRWVNDTQMISWSTGSMNFYSRNLRKEFHENLFMTCKHNFWRIRTSAFQRHLWLDMPTTILHIRLTLSFECLKINKYS